MVEWQRGASALLPNVEGEALGVMRIRREPVQALVPLLSAPARGNPPQIELEIDLRGRRTGYRESDGLFGRTTREASAHVCRTRRTPFFFAPAKRHNPRARITENADDRPAGSEPGEAVRVSEFAPRNRSGRHCTNFSA